MHSKKLGIRVGLYYSSIIVVKEGKQKCRYVQ